MDRDRNDGDKVDVNKIKVGILIIDDDAESQSALRQVLGSEDFETGIAPGGDRALQELATGNWTLVVANVATTGVSGALYLTLRELAIVQATEAVKARVRVLFVVPESQAKQMQPVLEREHLPYALKPFHFADFLEKVSDLLMETQAISQPIRRVRPDPKSRNDRMMGYLGSGQDGARGAGPRDTGMFANRRNYPMSDEEIAEYERYEQQEIEEKKKKKKPQQTHLG